MSPIKDLRDALYTLVDGIDISEIWEPGWVYQSKYPPKQKVYPAFWVEPVTNSTQTLDSITNQSTFTYWISITESYEDAPSGEDTAIDLADLVYRTVLEAARNPSVLGEGYEAVFDGTPTGQWGFEERLGERVYRIEVAFHVTEPIELTP
jgi:hypothetical protein